ncbi:hypothetical protein ABVV53_06185 [Novosphingobium sp. RD2P27]|uniref:Lipoprotein n=1 Tax=Novosphingobium kalidii TaxID=3230299 RepID=A0ABV2D148_9SPHN
MKLLAAGLVFLATACGTAPAGIDYASRDIEGRLQAARYASPGRIVAAEVAFAQLARRKGTSSALLETAAEGAVIFVPQAVTARDWLNAHKALPTWIRREPHQVWMSCDGSLAVTYGAWQAETGGAGDFITVWQRQRNGEYKWVMTQDDELAMPLKTPEMIGTSVASCGAARSQEDAGQIAGGTPGGASEDGTLTWSARVDRSCARTVEVQLERAAGTTMETVLTKRVAPPVDAEGRSSMSCVTA